MAISVILNLMPAPVFFRGGLAAHSAVVLPAFLVGVG